MKWITANGATAPQDVVDAAEAAGKEFGVPVPMICAIIERECNFREPAKPNSVGATGYMQIKAKFAEDYQNYAGFPFKLTGFDGLRGCVAALKMFAEWAVKRKGYKGDDIWRYVICVHRYGQSAPETRSPSTAARVLNVEKYMHANKMWYGEQTAAQASKPTAQVKPASPVQNVNAASFAAVAARAAKWALSKVGCKYSQAQRMGAKIFDCSSLVARAYDAQGATFTCKPNSIAPRSCEEVYDDKFRLIWPASYASIGRAFGGDDVILRARQPGDIHFYCTDSNTSRSNKITHVVMVVDAETIVHARGTSYGVVTTPITQYGGTKDVEDERTGRVSRVPVRRCCALLRYDPACPLRLGHKGDRVKALQEKLNARGANLVVDGDYGRKTANAVAAYGIKE